MLELYIFFKKQLFWASYSLFFLHFTFLVLKIKENILGQQKTLNRINDQNNPTYIISTNTTNKNTTLSLFSLMSLQFLNKNSLKLKQSQNLKFT